MLLTPVVNQIFSILTILGQVIIIGLIILGFTKSFNQFISKNAVLFSFVVALIAALGSLYFSEVAGYTPCKLCWFQRIFMYPQIIILGIALWRKEKEAIGYSFALSILGAVIAGYHYLLQIGVAPAATCGITGYSISCSQRFIMQFGYITIPMMAFTAFLLIIVFSLANYRNRALH